MIHDEPLNVSTCVAAAALARAARDRVKTDYDAYKESLKRFVLLPRRGRIDMAVKGNRDNMTVEEAVDKMKPCPFCACIMGILVAGGGGYQWFGCHPGSCALGSNPSASYGRVEGLLEDWNERKELICK